MKTTAAALALLLAFPAHAATPAPNPDRWVSVAGEGEASAKPDTLSFSAAVWRDAKEASGARGQIAAALSRIKAVITKAGIAPADADVSPVSVDAQNRHDPGKRPVQSGYRAAATVAVRLRDPAKYDTVSAALLEAGASELRGTSWESSRERELADEARARAVADARDGATGLARAAGAKLGKVRTIEDRGGGRPLPPLQVARTAGGMPSPGALAPNDVVIRVSVHVSWYLAD